MATFLKTLNYYKFTLLTILVILLLSLMNTDDLKTPSIFSFRGADKIIHMMMYAGLTLVYLTERSHLFSRSRKYKPVKLYSILWIIALGGFIELIQPVMGGREKDWMDFLANCAGTLLVFITFPLVMKPLFR